MEKLPTSSKALRYLPFLVASAFFMQMLDATILNTAIPTIARSFNSHPLQLHSLVTAYMLTVCVLMPASGWISDKLGSRRTFLLAISVFSVGSLLCALSASVTMMTVCRVIQGIGGAFLMPVGRLVILRSYPRSMFVNVLNIVTIPALLGPPSGAGAGRYHRTVRFLALDIPDQHPGRHGGPVGHLEADAGPESGPGTEIRLAGFLPFLLLRRPGYDRPLFRRRHNR